jgi:hypothetical protein
VNRRALLSAFLAAPVAVKLGRRWSPAPAPEPKRYYDVAADKWYPTFVALWAAHGWHLHGRHIQFDLEPGAAIIEVPGNVPDNSSVTCCRFERFGEPAPNLRLVA